MTTIGEAADLITKRFITQWGTETVFALPNKEFAKEDLVNEWVRLSITNLDGGQETLGGANNRKFEYKGIIFIQVFVEVNSGTKRAYAIVQKVRDIFEGVQFNDIHVDSVLADEVGIDGKWFQIGTESHFTYHATK